MSSSKEAAGTADVAEHVIRMQLEAAEAAAAAASAAAAARAAPAAGTDEVPEEEEEALPEPEDLDELIGQIVSDDPPTRFFGIQSLRRRVSDDYEMSYSRLLHSKAYDVIVGSLGNDQLPDLQYECAWVLTNMLSNRLEKMDLLANGGLCQPLVKLMANAADRTREQACWALANIVGECAEWRDQTLVCGLLPALTALWDSKPSTGILDATSLLLVNLFRDREPRVSFEVVKALLPYMLSLLDHPHTDLVPHVVWALSYLIEDSEPRVRLLLQEDLLQRLRRYLGSKDDSLLVATLRVFGNISSTLTPLPSCVLADGALNRMRPLLDHPEQKVRRQVLFFVSNVSDGPDSHLQQIVDAGFLARVGLILLEADELEKREAFWIVPNFIITRGSKFKSLIINSCMEGFLEALSLNDPELTHCVLLSVRELLLSSLQHSYKDLNFGALRKRIERSGGLKKIELVQKHMEDKELQKMSYQIIDHFFWHNGERYQHSDAAVGSVQQGSDNDPEEGSSEQQQQLQQQDNLESEQKPEEQPDVQQMQQLLQQANREPGQMQQLLQQANLEPVEKPEVQQMQQLLQQANLEPVQKPEEQPDMQQVQQQQQQQSTLDVAQD